MDSISCAPWLHNILTAVMSHIFVVTTDGSEQTTLSRIGYVNLHIIAAPPFKDSNDSSNLPRHLFHTAWEFILWLSTLLQENLSGSPHSWKLNFWFHRQDPKLNWPFCVKQSHWRTIICSSRWTLRITVAHKCNGETKSHGKTNVNSRHNKINLQSNETSRQNKTNSLQNNINWRQNKINSRQNKINSRQNTN